jgi:hypothetical protein
MLHGHGAASLPIPRDQQQQALFHSSTTSGLSKNSLPTPDLSQEMVMNPCLCGVALVDRSQPVGIWRSKRWMLAS